jgi:hypothetical protein
MSSPTSNFEDLIKKIREGREVGHTGFEPIYYLVFSPSQILDIKRQTPAWEARLRNEGWEVTTFSVSEAIERFVRSHPLWNIWSKGDKLDPLKWTDTNKALSNALSSEQGLPQLFKETLEEIQGDPKALLLVTDLEGLHPLVRIGAIEAKLSGRFTVPTIFLYPGERTGQTRLKFLSFYPEDGNYRSVHIGG